jgi:hypothetical protein
MDSAPHPDLTSPGDATRPVLYLDVDGVLNPFRSNGPHKHWPDYKKHTVTLPDGRSFRMWFSRSLGRMLGDTAAQYNIEIVWATSWAAYVDDLVVPLANLPAGLRILDYPDSAEVDLDNTGKVAEVAADAGSRPVIWVDDYLGRADRAWASARPHPTLLIRPSASIGLRYADLSEIETFAKSLAS